MTTSVADILPPDPPRVDLEQEHEVRFWTQRFEVDETRLRHLIRRDGYSPRDIDDALGVIPDTPQD